MVHGFLLNHSYLRVTSILWLKGSSKGSTGFKDEIRWRDGTWERLSQRSQRGVPEISLWSTQTKNPVLSFEVSTPPSWSKHPLYHIPFLVRMTNSVVSLNSFREIEWLSVKRVVVKVTTVIVKEMTRFHEWQTSPCHVMTSKN